MKRLSSVTMLLATLTACGGASTTPTTPGGPTGPDGKPSVAGDVTFEVPVMELKGIVFLPEALGNPDMAIVEAKKKTTIDKQRATFASTKDPVQKQAHAAILATMLFRKSQTEEGAAAKATLEDARQVLRDAAAAATAAKAEVDEITLRLLGTYELMLDDHAGAEKAWSALATQVAAEAAKAKKKAPPKELDEARAWQAYAMLMQGKNTEVLDFVKGEELTEQKAALAYVVAWARWRTGDDAGAWTALQTAAKGSGNFGNRGAIERDLFLLAGRVNVPMAEVTAALFALTNAKQKGPQYDVLVKLGRQSYMFGGRWADGTAALEQAITIAGTTIPPNDLPSLRYQQGDYTLRLDDPTAVAKYAKAALAALPGCGAACPDKDKQDLIAVISSWGQLLHAVYASANDIRYHQPAADIYQAVLAVQTDAGKRAQVQSDVAKLDATLKNTKVGTGTHDKQTIGWLLNRRAQEVQACYEEVLLSNPTLAGTLTLTLESDQTGAIKGVATEPATGLAGLAAVAGCAQERAKTWTLPKRGMAGNTRIKLSYALAPRDK